MSNEPRLAALKSEVADQATSLELAESEKLWITREMVDLKEQLFKVDERIAELRAVNVELNTTCDEAIVSWISTQEELKYCKSDRFKKNIIDDFKSSTAYHEEISREPWSFLDKGCIHIIRQLHLKLRR